MAIGAFSKLAIAANGFSSTNKHYLLRKGYPVTWRDTKCAELLRAMKNVRDHW